MRSRNAQRLQFAEQQQSEHVIDVGIEQNGAGDGRLPQAVTRGCRSGVASICARRSGEAPSRNHERGVRADGDLRLGAGFAAEGSGSQARQFGQAQFH